MNNEKLPVISGAELRQAFDMPNLLTQALDYNFQKVY